ncbi:EndoU domain-containing protein [Clostridium mediterraneense]|uniref:EndoU domain-containing protein n=1 Tax=Clostridium mediterraneense TaxID=1805472 RepID=UPI00082C77F3|nr:EndoU domain-containing protein [Clostridium mediterraneense]
MTYEEIMGITPGSIVPNGFSITPNATYIGPGEPILDAEGNVAPGGHYVNKWDKILVLDIGYTRQLTLIQYPVGNNEVRQGYITNSLSKIEYSDLENNFWQNGSTTETVYLSCSGDAVLGSLNPHERAIFLYKAGDRYSVVYSTDKGPYTKSGFVNYSGGISAQITQGRCLASGGSLINGIPAGGIVPGGRTYPANAVVKNDFLYIRDKNGTIITGRQTSIGDEITVLDISYSKQLALIQYPAGNDIRQGYVTNSTKIINYLNPYQWVNGSTPETVYLDVECTKEFGTIDPYESATLLYEKDGKYCVVYDAPGKNGGMDMLNKNGFVHFPGNKPQATPSAGDLLYQSFPANVEKIPYGTSPLGHPLNVYKIGNGSNVLFANFAIHGFEDDWNHDGTALVNIANELIRKISATGDLYGWTVYVNNCANPDGTFNGITNDGPGRCTVTTGIDMNRCFPSGFRPLYNTRNYVGASPLGAPESIALKNIVEKIHSEHINGSNQMVVVDFHGWMGMTQGNQAIGRYFNAQFNGDVYYTMADGFFSTWAQESLSNTRAVLVEYPKNTRSIDECDHRDYAGRTYTAIMNLFGNEAGQGSSSSSQHGNTNVSSYNAIGQVNSPSIGWLHVRKNAGTGVGCDVLGKLNNEELVQITGKTSVGGTTWYKLKYGNGEAFASGDYITILNPTTINRYGNINSPSVGWAHIRELPGTGDECKVVAQLDNNTPIDILEEFCPKGAVKPWYKINYHKNSIEVMDGVGFIRSDLVTFDYEDISVRSGWFKSKDGNWYYFVDGKALTGVWTIDDLFRVFDKNGKLLVNKQSVETEFGLAFIDEDAVATFGNVNQYAEFAVSPFDGYKNTDIFTIKSLLHIFRGEIRRIISNNEWVVSGGHVNWAKFDPMLKPAKKIFIDGTRAYEGPLENYNNVRIIKEGEHAWFPDEWNPQKIINIIKAGFEQGTRAEYSGEERIPYSEEVLIRVENVIIKIVISKNTNKIITAYPLCMAMINRLTPFQLLFIKDINYKTSSADDEPEGKEVIDGEDENEDEDTEGEENLE